ncbi:GGDEF domain-containing protein [Actinoplanes palleronii]|uniref:GGDEF domain-containing protein n=1 Tax=Actinoplanes palleronii TaxID=113570 RepID=A0ABQ4BHN3_9ACTN|nr:GGDEF domain-containing protein [Actinoplanes palleronii]GIE70193.1 hypothetical protein Apa02nite_063010 [Actinoplanes palleronii]
MIAGAVATAVYALLPTGERGHATGYGLIGAGGIAAVVHGVRRYRPRQPATWYTFAAGLAVWLVSTVINRLTAVPSWTMLSALLEATGYPLMCWALAGLIRGRARADDRTALIDAGMAATGLGLLCWIFVIAPAITDEGLPWDQKALTVILTVGDIGLFVLGSLLLTTPGARTVSYRLLLTALLLNGVCDVLEVALPAPGPGESGLADVVALLANSIAAAAALHPSMRRLTVPLEAPPAFVRPRLVLLTVTILLAPAVSLYQGATGHADQNWLAVGIASITLFLLVAARMGGLVRRVETQSYELAQLARHDALTGLPNRRHWDERLAAALARGTVTGEPLFVALIDLDHFKVYNDTYGHQAGDELLAGAALLWQRELRDGDLLARYGGEEFVMLLTGCTATEAFTVLERQLAATPQAQTFSAGLTRWDGEQTPDQLLHHADELLYQSKRSGRARITTAHDHTAAA